MEHHPKFSPSAFPALKKCIRFNNKGCIPRGYSEEGISKHEEVSRCIRNRVESKDNDVNYAIEAVKNIVKKMSGIPFYEHTLKIDEKVTIYDNDLNEVSFGTSDLIVGNFLIADWKNGEARDYSLQMMMYAIGVMQMEAIDSITVVEVYLKYHAVKEYVLTLAQCISETSEIIDNVNSGNGKCKINDYCIWCGDAYKCPELTSTALTVAEGYKPNEFRTWHPSEVADPGTMGTMLDMWKNILKPWGESVEFNAKKMADNGIIPTGYDVQVRAGNREVKDLEMLFKATCMSPKKFLSCCKITLGKLEVELGTTKKEFNKFIEQYTERGKDVIYLIKEKK